MIQSAFRFQDQVIIMPRRSVGTASNFCFLFFFLVHASRSLSPRQSRRLAITNILISPSLSILVPQRALGEEGSERPFVSAGFPKKEYTNSIVASRDTNISPLEVYETLKTRLKSTNGKDARALDVGAGAGVSTQVFYQQLGYTNIDAVDWSGEAWQLNVVEGGYCPPSVKFYELDDERFLLEWKKQGLDRYDIIAFNFAVNRRKALYFCQNLLKPDGLLLAPINTQNDYWLKQTYQLLDAEGRVVWSANDVGAWSVQVRFLFFPRS